MVLPLIPLCVLLCAVYPRLMSVSVWELSVVLSNGLLAEISVVLSVSSLLGHEALRSCQQAHAFVFCGAVFVNLLLLIAFDFLLLTIFLVDTCWREAVQLSLSLMVTEHFWLTVFAPAMTINAISTSVRSNLMYMMVFAHVGLEKRRMVSWNSKSDNILSIAIAWLNVWSRDTYHAMRNVFRYCDGASRNASRGGDEAAMLVEDAVNVVRNNGDVLHCNSSMKMMMLIMLMMVVTMMMMNL